MDTTPSSFKSDWRIWAVLILWSIGVSAATGQEPNPAAKTILDVEILLPAITGDPLLAQRWRQVFEKFDVGVRIRQPLPGDKAEVTESIRGTFRLVKIVGELDRQGRLIVPGRTFTTEQTGPLKEWLNELQTFGAQGAPEGKPRWGLSETQFDRVLEQLQAPIATPVRGKTVAEALGQLPMAPGLSVKFHTSSSVLYEQGKLSPVNEELTGLSCGTGLAFLLREIGLGYRPLRNPAGEIELMVQPLTAISDPWPVGWKVEDVVPRDQIVPGLFKMVTTGFENARLSDVLDAIEEKSGTIVLTDHAACAEKRIDLQAVVVNYPLKRTAWALLLRSAIGQARLSVQYLQDEAGTGFALVVPFVPMTLKPQ